MKKKLLFVFGTRPEAIKMLPVFKELKKQKKFDTKLCVTAQHRDMLDQVLDIFEIKPDFDLNIMKKNQTLGDITSLILKKLPAILSEFKPDLVLVHGDTTTTLATSLSAYYQKIDVAHIEAGLRTNNIYIPFPEEINRQLTSKIAKYHFAPTEVAKKNLLKENIKEENIFITGNSVIDALFFSLDKVSKNKKISAKFQKDIDEKFNTEKKIIVVTGHRRESFGQGFMNICNALKEVAKLYKDANIVYPVHLNPNVKNIVYKKLKNIKNIFLVPPMDYLPFTYLISKAYIILTDSGGIQEEAPSLNKPVLVMRDTTERPEAIKAGSIKLVGTDKEKIVKEVQKLFENSLEYEKMARAKNPYGNGTTSFKIAKILSKVL